MSGADSLLGPVTVIGEALIDIVRSYNGGVTERVGGSPLNVAIGLGRLGVPATLISALGTDQRATTIRAHLERSSVAIDAVTTRSGRTSTATASLAEDGTASYDFAIEWELRDRTRRFDASIVHAGSLAAALSPGDEVVFELVERARSAAAITFDPNIRASLMRPLSEQLIRTERFFALADVVKLSDEDAAWLYPGRAIDDVADLILGLGAQLVVVTRGSRGLIVRSRGVSIDQDADSSGVVDTIGAGDSCMAGIILELARHLRTSGLSALRTGAVLTAPAVQRIALTAQACAAHTVRRAGADLPWTHELDARLERE